MGLCTKCEDGPKGMQGHEDLHLLNPKKAVCSPGRFVLACLGCGAQWSRLFGSDGIRWMRADSSAA